MDINYEKMDIYKKVFILLFILSILHVKAIAQISNIYFDEWIDFNKNGKKDIYEDPSKKIEERVADLLQQMTLDEKTCQMVTLYGYGRVLRDELPQESWKESLWKDGIGNIDEQLSNTTFRSQTETEWSYPYSKHAKAINEIQKWFIEETRLGIPVDFTIEGIRGLAHDRATCFPANISMGSTWNKELIYNMGCVIGKEAKALGYTNVYAPILDLSRDPRWGRTVECFGEDPYLVAELGVRETKGIQEQGVASTLKHYAVYSVPLGGRDGEARTSPQVTFRELHNINLYPFREVLLRAGAMGVMSSYNDYDGVPVSGSFYFLNQLLRKEYKFKGYVVSDSDAIEFLYTKHKVASNYKNAIKQSAEAGVNIRTSFTEPEVYVYPLRELLKEEKLSVDVVDQRVREILYVKFYLGLFDQPFIKDTEESDEIVRSKEHEEIAKKASYESLVLLKNENNILPLNIEDYKSILVVGENAVDTKHSFSRYGPNNIEIVSVLDGITSKVGKSVSVKYAKGCKIEPENMLELEMFFTPPEGQDKEMIDEAVNMAEGSDLAIVVLGDHPGTVGESKSRTSLKLSGYQEYLLRKIHKTGTPVVLVLINGRPVTINWADKYIPAILEAWFPGEFGGNAIADVLFGDYNPGGKLSVTFPRSVGQIPFSFPNKPAAHAGQGNGKSRIIEELYPFGYGLSFTSFKYSALNIDVSENQDTILVKCKVENTGQMAGDEVVQLYFSDLFSSVTVYEKQLRGFERIHLIPGETEIVEFVLYAEDLSLLDKDMNRVTEKGTFEIMVGSSSEDIKLKQVLEIKNTKVY